MPSAGEPNDLTLYTKPGCVQCVSTKRALQSAGVPYRETDVTQSEQAYARVSELGYQALPVIELPFDRMLKDANGETVQHWYGFRPDLIAQLKTP